LSFRRQNHITEFRGNESSAHFLYCEDPTLVPTSPQTPLRFPLRFIMIPNLNGAKKRRPPRRRSCEACIRAKRRCDPGTLACTRCTKQGLNCHYVSPLTSLNQEPFPGVGTEVIGHAEPSQSSFPSNAEPRACEAANFTTENLLDMGPLDMFLLNENNLDLGFDETRVSQLTAPNLYNLPLPADKDKCPFELPIFSASRLNYGINELKMSPSRIVLESQTPWSHPLLYEDKMPTSMHGRQNLIVS
jgi:hypothetical protein